MKRAGISRRQFAAGSAGAAAVTALAVPASRARAETFGGTLVIGHVSLRHLNPAIQSGNATGVPGMQIFAGLVQLDDNAGARSRLCGPLQTVSLSPAISYRMMGSRRSTGQGRSIPAVPDIS
jgi:hypothetical protein